MYTDIVFPKNNEKEFIAMAEQLGYSSLYFVYEYKNKSQIEHIKNNIIQLKYKTKFEILLGLKVKHNEITKVRKFVNLVLCESSDKNRWILEKTKDVILYNLEHQKRRDFIHHRNSGLNQVLCKFASQNNHKIGIAFSYLLHADEKLKPILFGRISQNIRLCRKYEVSMVLASFATNIYDMRSPYDLQSFGIVLGMHPSEAKKSVTD